jgi:glycosyltransferase involved in cell wall biosynthesis
MLAHMLDGPKWSFTVHGPEEFDKPGFIGLAEKIQRAAFVVAVSSFGRSQLFRCVSHQHWNKISVVHCGLEPQFFAGKAEYSDARSFVCVGRLCEQKGQMLLVEAARRLVERGIDMHLTFAGDGELRPEIEALIKEYKLESNIRITGWIASDDVRRELLGARALILPSFAEGLPVVIMEAMALRRPVISTFVAGIPELVSSSALGWLVPAGDIEALVTAIRSCVDTAPEVLTKMGDAAFEAVVEAHNVDKETVKLAGLFATSVIMSLA